ncbi:MAG: DUF433 domain-containing protein [Planctomycetaceae bacterium]|nr:DUF433 domain-containing protein [Planctomycetaceae bacterium]
MDWKDLISVDPLVCHGRACLKGTRIPVSVVLDNLAAGVEPAELQTSYPTLTRHHIAASLEYAAELARERRVALPTGVV